MELLTKFAELIPLIGFGARISKDEIRIGIVPGNVKVLKLSNLKKARKRMNTNGSFKWLITIRTIMILSGILNLIGMGWFKFITTKTLETEKTVAVLCSQMNGLCAQMNRIENRLMGDR